MECENCVAGIGFCLVSISYFMGYVLMCKCSFLDFWD